MNVQLDYKEHPAFPADVKEYSIDSKIMDRFNMAYEAMLKTGTYASPSISASLRKALFRSLGDIEQELLGQVESSIDQAFLENLFHLCKALLGRDADFYFRSVDRKLLNSQDSEKEEEHFVELCENGFFVGALRPATLKKILQIIEPLVADFRQRAAEGLTKREDLSANGGQPVWEVLAALNKDFDELGVNRKVSLYCGRPMRAMGLAIELSPSNADWWKNKIPDLAREPETIYYHIDEGPQNPKSIVYLSDVTLESGATSVAPGFVYATGVNHIQILIGRTICNVGRSSKGPLVGRYQHQYHQVFACPVFRADFMKLPAALRWNSHFGWDAIPGSDYEQELVDREKRVVGPAGTFLVFDGYTLAHRGGLVTQGERIALQVIFDVAKPPGKIRSLLSRIKKLMPGSN